TVVLDGHVNAAVDEELHRLVVPMPDELVQHTRRLMRTPGRVDVRAVLKKEIGYIEMAVDDRPGERHVEHTLLAQRAPLPCIFRGAIPRDVRAGWVVILDVAQRRRAGLVEPLLHSREVADACRMR